MYVKLDPFGYNVYGETIGSVWLSLVEAIIKNGTLTEDEDRKRLYASIFQTYACASNKV